MHFRRIFLYERVWEPSVGCIQFALFTLHSIPSPELHNIFKCCLDAFGDLWIWQELCSHYQFKAWKSNGQRVLKRTKEEGAYCKCIQYRLIERYNKYQWRGKKHEITFDLSGSKEGEILDTFCSIYFRAPSVRQIFFGNFVPGWKVSVSSFSRLRKAL